MAYIFVSEFFHLFFSTSARSIYITNRQNLFWNGLSLGSGVEKQCAAQPLTQPMLCQSRKGWEWEGELLDYTPL